MRAGAAEPKKATLWDDLVDDAETVVTATAGLGHTEEITGFIEDHAPRRICSRFPVEEAEHAVRPSPARLGCQFEKPAIIRKTTGGRRSIKIAGRIERETTLGKGC